MADSFLEAIKGKWSAGDHVHLDLVLEKMRKDCGGDVASLAYLQEQDLSPPLVPVLARRLVAALNNEQKGSLCALALATLAFDLASACDFVFKLPQPHTQKSYKHTHPARTHSHSPNTYIQFPVHTSSASSSSA